MSRTIRVYLMGSEQKGWALDADLATIRQSLALVHDVIEAATLQEADVVHSVWEYPLLTADRRRLEGKRVVCTFCNDVIRTFEQACMIHAREVVGLWIAISRKAERDARSLGLPVTYIPYAIDPGLFADHPPCGEARAAVRNRLGLPEKAYVISNFMRDSMGANLLRPKPQKGVEMFVEIVCHLSSRGHPVHVLLAGPRRHWVRSTLRTRGVPCTFVGEETEQDDNNHNILDAATISALYHASDLHLVTSRWEGGPRAVLEAAATKVRIASTPEGLAADVLDSACIFKDVDSGVDLVEKDIVSHALVPTIRLNADAIRLNHTPAANVGRYTELYRNIWDLPVYHYPGAVAVRDGAKAGRDATSLVTRMQARWLAYRRRKRPGAGLRMGIWHEFHKPPYGGGNQFMLALKKHMERLGVSVACNSTSSAIDVHICNSAWFATNLLDRAVGGGRIRMIHRIDGPVGIYRGTDMAEDDRIHQLNERFASATVMQSAWCLKKTLELGYRPRRPVIIHNAVDDSIFHPGRQRRIVSGQKLRLVASSWSDNPRKGGPFYKALEGMLDWTRFEFTFVGRTQQQFTRIRHVDALPSGKLAGFLRSNDVYIAASRNEPCSNALIEALACGLPALYLDDGAHGELVGQGGLPFKDEQDFLVKLDRISQNYDLFRACVWVESMDDIARRYIELALTLINDDRSPCS